MKGEDELLLCVAQHTNKRCLVVIAARLGPSVMARTYAWLHLDHLGHQEAREIRGRGRMSLRSHSLALAS